MPSWIKNPRIVVPGLIALSAAIWLAFGVFGVHRLFVDDEVNEAVPVFATPAVDEAPATGAGAAGQIVTEFRGTFVSRDHPTSGEAVVLGNGTEQRFLRFESFETDNGPDLNVYLVNSAAGGVEDAVDLGELKGNVGEQNYEIPAGVDLSVYDTVVIWCVRFSSPFGDATLVPT